MVAAADEDLDAIRRQLEQRRDSLAGSHRGG